MPNNRIRILYTVATFIYNEACNLFAHGTAHDIYGNELPAFGNGELDEIPSDSSGYHFAQQMAKFIRYVAQIMALALQEEQENMIQNGEVDQILNDITNNE